MKIFHRNKLFLVAVLLVATFFSSFAKQREGHFISDPVLHSVPKPKSNVAYKMRVILIDKVERAWDKTYFLNLDLRTNLLYNVTLLPTLGFEWHKNRKFGVKVDGGFAHWGSRHGMVQNIWFVNPEVRWYIKNANRLYIGAGINAGRINIYRGVIGGLFFPEDTGYQSGFFSGCISAGYKLILTRNIAFDFNLGLGGTHFKYDSFTVIDETRVYQRIKMKDVTKNLMGPTQAGVSLVWKLFGHRNWR